MQDEKQTMDFGPARRTGFYAGAFEFAAETGQPMLAVAFRRTESSTVEIFKCDKEEDAPLIMTALLKDGVALKDMWPITINVGGTSKVQVYPTWPEARR
jgi:hypothetical protein